MLRLRSRLVSPSLLLLVATLFGLLSSASTLSAAGPVCTVATSGGTYTGLAAALADTGCTTIRIASGDFATNVTIARSVTIEGAGTLWTRLDGGGSQRFLRVLSINPGVQVELRSLTVRQGNAGALPGGGIYNAGTLTLKSVLVQLNSGGNAGAIYNTGALTVNESSIADNSGGSVGGILNDGTLTMSRSDVTGNSGVTSGIINTGQLSVVNSTFSANTGNAGAVINNYTGATTIRFSTIAGNTGGIASETPQSSALFNPGSGTLSVQATIIANNNPGPNCSSGITSQGYNISDDSTCSLSAVGDQPSTDPQLGTISIAGGIFQFYVPLAQSPAIDAVPVADCPPTDQRGFARPIDGDGANGAVCDIGAIEFVVQNRKLYLSLLRS